MTELDSLLSQVADCADPECASNRLRFFKTQAGSYGAGDEFVGLTVPQQRRIAKQFRQLPLADLHRLLQSKVHEHRFIALVILVHRYEHAPPKARPALVEFYLKHLKRVNNWDLVDASAPYILGAQLRTGDDRILDEMAHPAAVVAASEYDRKNRPLHSAASSRGG